jgi:hypothetical protein
MNQPEQPFLPGDLAAHAANLLSGARHMTYGDPLENAERTARLFKILTGVVITPLQVVQLMLCVKLSREANYHGRDNLVDVCGYADCINYIIERTEERTNDKG